MSTNGALSVQKTKLFNMYLAKAESPCALAESEPRSADGFAGSGTGAFWVAKNKSEKQAVSPGVFSRPLGLFFAATAETITAFMDMVTGLTHALFGQINDNAS